MSDVLKGKIEGGVITVKYPVDPGIYGIWLKKSDCALFFLMDGVDGTYVFSDPITARMPITREKVSMPADSKSTTAKLEAELSASLTDPDSSIALTALKQIGNLGHSEYGVKPNLRPNTISSLEQITVSGDAQMRGLAYAALIKIENYELLEPAVDFASSGGPESDGIIAAVNEIGDIKLREAKRITDDPDMECPSRANLPTDESVLYSLHSLLSSPKVELRRAAVHSLRGICDPSSANVLVGALSDDDRQTQYEALQGLAAMENFPEDHPAPARSDFNADPSKYLENWKSWWGAVGRQKYATNR